MYPWIPWEVVTDPLGSGHGSPGKWSRIPWEVVTDPLGSGHGSPGKWSRVPWEVVTDPLGSGHGSPGKWTRIPWEVVTDPLGPAKKTLETADRSLVLRVTYDITVASTDLLFVTRCDDFLCRTKPVHYDYTRIHAGAA
jgi:hypothetical protein